MELAIAFRELAMMYLPPEAFAMCSEQTQNLGNIFINYIYSNCCDDRPENFYPLLDRIVDWMDLIYGGR